MAIEEQAGEAEVELGRELYGALSEGLKAISRGDQMTLGLALQRGAGFESLPEKVRHALADLALDLYDEWTGDAETDETDEAAADE